MILGRLRTVLNWQRHPEWRTYREEITSDLFCGRWPRAKLKRLLATAHTRLTPISIDDEEKERMRH